MITDSYIAICPGEFCPQVEAELSQLGAKDISPIYKGVAFKADEATAYAIHLALGSASQLLMVLRQGYAKTPDKLFFQALKINWPEVLHPQYTFAVRGIAGDRGEGAPPASLISKKIREAIQRSFSAAKKPSPAVNPQEPGIEIVGYFHGGQICISIATSGKSLHKRGYKLLSHPAPIKEHVAWNILRHTGYDGSQALWDPMCGSGTFPIEAAYMALKKAPLIHRKQNDFTLTKLKGFDNTLWREQANSIRSATEVEIPGQIYATDIRSACVDMTKKHALRARVERHIRCAQRDLFDGPPPAPTGIMVTNLPYGDRLQPDHDEDGMLAFYQKLGDYMKQQMGGWSCWLVVKEDSAWKRIGLRPSLKLPMENGGLRCRLLRFDIYSGSQRKRRKPSEDSVSI